MTATLMTTIATLNDEIPHEELNTVSVWTTRLLFNLHERTPCTP
jgi:hypothetical protein